MGEHGIWWSRDLYDPTIRVPLIIAPGEAPVVSVVSQPVRSIDIAPTLFELLGVESASRMDGRSLLPLMRGEPDAASPPVLSFSLPETDYGRPVASVRSADWKLIRRDAGWQGRNHWTGSETELYDLRSDPAEERDVAGDTPERVAPMAELIEGWQGRGSARGELSPERRAMLKELGYLE